MSSQGDFLSAGMAPKSAEWRASDAFQGAGRVGALDGLRAVGVMMVVVGHALPMYSPIADAPVDFLGRAATGVTLFFVLSGYLITSIFMREQDKGTFSFGSFYRRRIIRLWPALYAYLAFLTLLKLTTSYEIADWLHLLFASLHVWNYALPVINGSEGYQASAAHLMHLWSLAVEEQFYWLWPIAFFAVSDRKRLIILLCATIVLLPAVRLGSYVLFETSRPFLTKMFHTAADPLLIGCLLALFPLRVMERARWLARGYALPILLAALFSVSYFLGKPLASYYSLTIGTTIEAIIAAGIVWTAHHGERGIAHDLLCSRPLQVIGLSSYSIYLWQNIFTRPNAVFDLPFAFGILASLVAGFVSYRLIEKPTQRWAVRRFAAKTEKVE
ncbi:acyltransferase family protein [Porphyrobacter sp. AAP60]|uniref:acyltransferase family protein n=1 Tax=Porphyrobacter sp. AAP60 TaxID=1523423 RepID=UPI0006B89258|nr:acyltransferase [Porphyrobacter sp. AAP60]KPF63283.1 hypothetical protein IP79_10370 [Porphyrobacter sp. AAP60]